MPARSWIMETPPRSPLFLLKPAPLRFFQVTPRRPCRQIPLHFGGAGREKSSTTNSPEIAVTYSKWDCLTLYSLRLLRRIALLCLNPNDYERKTSCPCVRSIALPCSSALPCPFSPHHRCFRSPHSSPTHLPLPLPKANRLQKLPLSLPCLLQAKRRQEAPRSLLLER